MTGWLQLPDDNTINESISSNTKIFQTASEKLPQVEPAKLFNNLSFSHFVELIYIDNPLKRIFYEIETIKGCWSVKELSRQIESLCYERSSFSKNPLIGCKLCRPRSSILQNGGPVCSPLVELWSAAECLHVTCLF